jgi:hypothetical protein
LVAKSEGQRSPLRPGRKWEDNIKLGFKQVGQDDVKWIHVAMDRDSWQEVKNTVPELLVQKTERERANFLASWKTVSFSRSALLQEDAVES